MRVQTKKANRGATVAKTCEARPCRLTNEKIVPGQSYHTWAFFRGAPHYQHADCGYPKPSQLTQSKMVTVLAAIESAESDIAAIDNVDELPSPEDILSPVAEAAREVAEEYTAAAEAMGSAGEQNQERADELESFADTLESFSLSLGDWEPQDTASDDGKAQAALEEAEEERKESYLEDYKTELSDALSECPNF